MDFYIKTHLTQKQSTSAFPSILWSKTGELKNIPFPQYIVTYLTKYVDYTNVTWIDKSRTIILMVKLKVSKDLIDPTLLYNRKEMQSIKPYIKDNMSKTIAILQTGITPNRKFIKGIKDKLLNTYYLQAFSHSEEDVREAFNWVKKQKDPVLAGYASSLYVLAQFAEKMGEQIRFKTAISWGDKLFPHYRRQIEKVFGTKVHETYGSAEGLMMGAQRELDHMYLMNQNVFIEILDDQGKDVADGEMGHVVVTSLNAMAMPLIRYRIGDLAKMLPKDQYPGNCELHYPIIEKIIGRDTDLVRTPGGKMLVVHSFTGIFEHIPEISQFRITQEKLEGITIEFVPGEGYHDLLLDTIRERIEQNVKEPFHIQFIERNAIPPSASGKPQMIISKIASELS